MSDVLNTRIDRYEIRERIGSGGMARVYKAWDTKLDRWVAVKILHEHLADDTTFRARFEREAKSVAAFDHPNIVHIFDYNVIERDGYPMYYMVMSYIQGVTLRQMLEANAAHNTRLSQNTVLSITTDLSSALSYAHAHGVAHRDVKPGNILITESGQAILTDFGIARLVQAARLTQDGVSTGTPAYMSPEQAAGQAGDTRSDLYSLGVIVYEMLAGMPPFDDEGSLAVMLKHLNEPPPSLSDALRVSNRKLDLFMDKALAKNPDERFQSADTFIAALRRAFREDISTGEMLAFEAELGDKPTTVIYSLPPGQTPKNTTADNPSLAQTITIAVRSNPIASVGFAVIVSAAIILLVGSLVLSSTGNNSAAPTTIQSSSVPSMTGNMFFRSQFDGVSEPDNYWTQSAEGPFTREITNGVYHLENQRPQTAETTLFNGGNQYGNVTLIMQASLNEISHPASAYGIVFRYRDEDNYNVFAVDGEGRYSIWARIDGIWNELRELDEQWTPSEVVTPAGDSNLLSLDIISNHLTGYINDERVVQVQDDNANGGRVGIYVAADDGEAIVDVDSFQVFPSVPSMTGIGN